MRFAIAAVFVVLAFSSVNADLKGTLSNVAGQVLGNILSYINGQSGTQVVDGGLHLDYNIERCTILGVGKKRFIGGLIDKIKDKIINPIVDKVKPKCTATFTLRELGISGRATRTTQSSAVSAAMNDLSRQLGV